MNIKMDKAQTGDPERSRWGKAKNLKSERNWQKGKTQNASKHSSRSRDKDKKWIIFPETKKNTSFQADQMSRSKNEKRPRMKY